MHGLFINRDVGRDGGFFCSFACQIIEVWFKCDEAASLNTRREFSCMFLYRLLIFASYNNFYFWLQKCHGLCLMSGKPSNGYFVRIHLCLCIARVYAARIFWILYLCVTMSLNEGREFFSFFFFSVPFLCMNQGWQNALWIKLGWREGFGEITRSLVHIKVHSAQWHVIPRARHHTRQS